MKNKPGHVKNSGSFNAIQELPDENTSDDFMRSINKNQRPTKTHQTVTSPNVGTGRFTNLSNNEKKSIGRSEMEQALIFSPLHSNKDYKPKKSKRAKSAYSKGSKSLKNQIKKSNMR